ncbi:polysaccharide deacetylase family protein [Demequina sp. TTPB684]|uniref:polysaccharide deacetylase family protein n=1 Tax=unclassified Demequina TaxID=2620311 RepID=UPI001CF2B63E|nr:MULTISPECIES: polysaccharide deacetylase family protein [unclassified Demequina]MCB2413277.1 polysaccharide deacetylase family protein [Demequina sp. TTPB684]UPU88737.1 polysaccharide deacetylase family protein [Demequina sp. TMPB413]
MSLTTQPVRAAAGEGLVCALTFDDGPNGEDTLALLDMLATRRIRAVFAVIGEQIQAPGGVEMLRRTVADGHVLCNHSTSFADMGEWDADAVRTDMLENLAIIGQALDDADAVVPFWRAPNGSWGVTAQVAVELGMQPLDVANTIEDWIDQDVDLLEARLREAVTPGELVLVHDGGGNRAGSVAAVQRVVDEKLAQGWVFTLPLGAE